MIEFSDLHRQQDAARPALERRIAAVLAHGRYMLGPEVRELAGHLAAFTGSKHCVMVAIGTDGLLISRMALGTAQRDEVIMTPFTFAATADVVVPLGSGPVFVDVEPDFSKIQAGGVEAKTTHRAKAIMPVSRYGQPADMDVINEVAGRHGGIPVIEDAAQILGATCKGRKSHSLWTLGVASFFPSKALGRYGDRGAILTNDDGLATA
ncbi:MAG TPA: DegT/DnrJ/EryC1/StrS family aminotransferase [Longimicrobiales bacterium]|nr:DegT/DnrJ/EryC1/StrS family aminotransferase [Longimicrobiales bacterium]